MIIEDLESRAQVILAATGLVSTMAVSNDGLILAAAAREHEVRKV